MTDKTSAVASTESATARTPAQTAFARRLLLQDIEMTWGKFDRDELSNLKDNDDLVTELVARYGLDKAAAQRDVDAFLKGRTL